MPVTINGTNGISAPNVYGRNLIINGSGRINQRAYVSGTNTTGANQYTLDRWRVVTSGQNLTFTGNDAAREMTAPAGGVEQVIEGANIVGGTYVLNWTGTATATVGGVAVAKGGTFTLSANTNATVRFTSGTFANVQLEAGSIATPFENLGYGQELARCQRYYYRANADAAYTTFGSGFNTSTTSASCSVPFPVKMRGAPSLGTSGVASQYCVVHGAVVTACSIVPSITGGNQVSSNTARVDFVVASGMTAGQGSMCLSNNTTTAFLGFDAEL
jgi:hypothetical protein